MLALLSFSGRASRREFWFCAVAPIATILGLVLLVPQVVGRSEFSAPGYPPVVGAAAMIVIAWLALAASARRLHDRDKSLLWLIPYFFGPAWLSTVVEGGTDLPAITAGWIAVALMIWGIIDVALLKGTPGPNRYGPAQDMR